MQLIASNEILIEKLTVACLANTAALVLFNPNMCTQDSAIPDYPQPYESNPSPSTLTRYYHFNIILPSTYTSP
jgi:hypothetical protein